MEFTLGAPLRVPITIDGTVYRFAKYLGKAFTERVERYKKDVTTAALNQFKPEDREGKALFMQRYPSPAPDVLYVEAELKTPDGCDEVIRWCGTRAEPPVPAETLDQMIEETPVAFKRALVDVLLGTRNFRDAMKKDSGEPELPGDSAGPLPSSGGQSSPPQPTSGDAPTPGTSTPPSTPTPTQDATQAS